MNSKNKWIHLHVYFSCIKQRSKKYKGKDKVVIESTG